MKFFISIGLGLLFWGMAFGQTPYPTAPPAAGNLTRIEYFIDTDPGIGNGIPLTITPQTNINALSTSIDLSSVTPGFHRIFFRVQQADGRWSFWLNNFFSNVVVPVYPSAPAAPGNINRIEYFLNTAPVPGAGIEVPITPATNIASLNFAVDISALTKSLHTLYVAARDESGRWSLTNFVVFSNSNISNYPSAPAAPTALQQMEYFIDNDPGFGNGTPVAITPATDIANFSVSVDLTGLADGTHYFFIRSRNNPWSQTNVVSFLKGAGLPVRWQFVRGEWKNQKALLEWGTSFEQNASHFEIEQSADGLQFRKVGTVKAKGNSNTLSTYSFTDDKALQGWNYYRIRQVDLDGQFSYSRVITLLNRDQMKEPLLYPNPAASQVYIELPPNVKWERVRVYNGSGQLELAQSINAGQTYMTLDVRQLAIGMHSVEIMGGDRKQVLRFVKN